MTNNSIKAAFQRFWEHVVAQLNGKADVNHTHDYADSVHNHDDIYYTESEIDNRFETMGTAFVDAFTTKEETAQAVETIVELMVNKADKNDLNYKADKDHNHDDIYYTESEINTKFNEVNTSIDELDTAILEHTHFWNDLKNRPFGYTFKSLPNVTSTTPNVPLTSVNKTGEKVEGQLVTTTLDYVVYFDGEYYDLRIETQGQGANVTAYLGNLSLCGAGSDNGLPFCLKTSRRDTSVYCYILDESTSHTISAMHGQLVKTTLAEEFIPDTIARKLYVDGLVESYETKSDATAKLTEAKAYADEVGSGLQTQLNTIVNNPDTEGVINSINEFTQYITEHGEIAEGFRTDIDSKASKETVNEHVADETVHITSEERETWNVAEENAKAYTDEQIGSHVHSWNDLTDKPFGEVSENVVLCYNKSLCDGGFFPDKSGIGEYTNYAAPLPTSMITVGDTYIATFNGVDYVDTARAIEDTSSVNGGIEIFGNFDSGFNDYPITLTSYADHLYFYSKDGKGGEMKLTHVRNSIKQLDEKFIPDTIARKTDVEPALSLATEAIISNTETISLHTEQITALQTEMATIVEITVEEVDALFAGLTE